MNLKKIKEFVATQINNDTTGRDSELFFVNCFCVLNKLTFSP